MALNIVMKAKLILVVQSDHVVRAQSRSKENYILVLTLPLLLLDPRRTVSTLTAQNIEEMSSPPALSTATANWVNAASLFPNFLLILECTEHRTA